MERFRINNVLDGVRMRSINEEYWSYLKSLKEDKIYNQTFFSTLSFDSIIGMGIAGVFSYFLIDVIKESKDKFANCFALALALGVGTAICFLGGVQLLKDVKEFKKRKDMSNRTYRFRLKEASEKRILETTKVIQESQKNMIDMPAYFKIENFTKPKICVLRKGSGKLCQGTLNGQK